MAGPWDDYKAKGSTDGKPWEEFGGKPEKPKTAAGDIARSLKSGVEQLPGIVTGIADLPTALAFGARPFTKAADAIGEATGFQPGKWAKETKYSEGYNDSKKAVDEAWKGVEGVAADPNKNWTDVAAKAGQDAGGIAAEYLKNPLYTANQVVESLPAMFAGGAVSKGLMTAGRVAEAGLTAEALAKGAMGPTRKAVPGYLERAVGEKMAAPVAGGIGEGAMQTGQQMEDGKDNPDQRKNAIAALGSGVGDAVISMGAGRLANKLGFETAQTAMAKAGDGRLATGLDAAKRIGGGVASEGLLQELPQSVQEQNWQNWAEGKPLMEGALRAGVEGAVAGGIMGAGANIHPGEQAPATPPPVGPGAVPPGPAPQLGHDPMAGTHTVFPDGSIVLNSESSNGAKTVRDMQRANRLENAADPFFGDPAPVKPSEAMGLAPTAGPSLANAAILSVDSGIHQAATESADPYNAPLSALGQELSRTNQRLRQEADALGLDTEGLHGDAARMTDGKSHEDYLMAANDQLRKAMKAAKEIPHEGQRSGSDDPATGSEAKGPDAQAGKAPAGDAGGPVRAGAVGPATDRVGEHGQRPAGTDGGSLPGAVAAPTRDQAIAKATDAAGKVLASGGTDADANRAATDSLIDQMAATPGIAIAQDAPAAVKAAKAKPPANNNAETTTSAPAAPAAGLPAAGPAPIQAAGVDQPDANKAKWLKAINDQNRLAGETGIQLKVVDGKLTFMGDPRSSKQGQALSATLDEAQKAGATIQEIIESIQTPKGATANVPQPAKPGTQASQAPSAQGAAPAGTAVAPTIDDAAHQAATSPNNALPQPTDGQKKAGNYAKGHVNLNGLDLSIENPAGSERSGTDKDGKAWKNTLKHHYGYIKGTVGNDKDHVDLFVKPETPLDYSGTVFVIDQHHPHNGRFDEHKVMVGFANEAQAKKAYHANYAKGWKGMKSITPMTFDAFKAWVKDGAKNTPVSKDPAVSTQPQGATREPQADQAQQAEAQRPQEQPAASGPVAGAPLPNATEPAPVTANPKIKAETDEKTDLDAQLAAVNDELDRQGAVQNANTRARRDAIRKQIAERDFPEIFEAVDGDISTAEDLNRAFQYAGDEPKAKTVERILKKRGVTPEYQKRWSERLLEGQQAGTKPESVVKVPEAIGTAIQEQMEKQKRRVMRRRSEESAPGLNLEQKAAAQTKTKAAEATLRAMRTSIFDAEDAAVKAVETGKASEFEKHADLFPAANDAIRAMLGQNDELDAEMQANEAGLTAQTRADDVKKLVDAAKKQEKEPAPGTRINGLAEPTAEQIAAIGDITIEVPTENGTAKMTVNAAKALASIDERLEALEMVQRCLA